MGTPADVVKARIMNQHTDEKGRGLVYKNSLDCFITTVKGEGFFGKKNFLVTVFLTLSVSALYKGFLPCWLRMAPWSLTFWLSYEQIRKAAGAKSW